MIAEYISLHLQLVHFLSQYDAFKVEDGHEGRPLFMKRKKSLYVRSGEEFTVAQLTGAAEVVAKLFNMVDATSGSNFDLPKLLQAYFMDEEKRKEINKLL